METQTLNTPATIDHSSIIEKSVIIFKDAGKILIANQDRTDKALNVGRRILQDIQANDGIMTAELDARCQKYLANVNIAVKEMNDNRSPVTQIMDALKKMYTETENKLDLKKADTIPAIIHGKRNQYVKQVFEEQERQRVEAERKTKIEKQKVDLAAWIKTTISNKLISYLEQRKLSISNSFNAITLDVFDQKEESLKKMPCAFPESKCAEIIAYDMPEFSLLDFTMKNTVRTEAHTAFDFKAFYRQYEFEVSELKQQLIDRLPSKKEELLEIQLQKTLREEAEQNALNAKNEKDRIEAIKRQQEIEAEQNRQQEEAEKRKQEEDDRIKKQAEESKLKAEQESESQRQAGNTMAMFDQAAAVNGHAAPEARQGYEIVVGHQAGWVEIFQFWFTNEGAKCTIDEIGKKTLNQMKKYCEDAAHKNDQKIVSKYLKYQPTFTAVNRKAK